MKITHLENSEQFAQLKETNEFLVLDFYSDECPPCEKLAPIYEKMADLFGSVLFVKAFRQENRALAESLAVSGSPTVLFFKKGELQEERLSGYIEEKDFLDTLEKLTGNKISEKEEQKFQEFDLAIIGNGPAGLSAAVYAARYKVNQVLIGDLPGGLMTSSHKICNYPSETEISGFDLSMKMANHVKDLEVPEKFARVDSITIQEDRYLLSLSNGEKVKAKTILLATGTKHRHLGLANEQALTGRGVSYCATCDGMFYANKTVAVIGGSDSANTAALYLAQVATKVYQIYRGENLRGEVAWIDQIKANPKISVIYNTQVTEILGEQKVSGVKINKPFDGQEELSLDGIFIEVGADPDQTLISQLGLEVDKGGYIKTESNQKTSLAGVWAAGDITTNSDYFKQIITACSEGSVAAQDIFKYLQSN
jgi:thioredoxin reductase (NADPH)